MNETPDTHETDNGNPLDPAAAAALLDQATQQARRSFQPNPPLISLLRAVVVGGAFGAVWLSVHGQHPYRGPSGWAIAVAYILVALVIGGSAAALKRRTQG